MRSISLSALARSTYFRFRLRENNPRKRSIKVLVRVRSGGSGISRTAAAVRGRRVPPRPDRPDAGCGSNSCSFGEKL